MKKFILMMLLGFSSLGFATENNFLFFQASAKGAITQAEKNTYTLTLNNASEYVSYFTERPARKSGIVSVNKFIS